VEIILDRFRAGRVDAIDIEPEMIELARRRLARRPQAHISLGDATTIDASDESFDALRPGRVVVTTRGRYRRRS